jgi:hypothetical protein
MPEFMFKSKVLKCGSVLSRVKDDDTMPAARAALGFAFISSKAAALVRIKVSEAIVATPARALSVLRSATESVIAMTVEFAVLAVLLPLSKSDTDAALAAFST